MDWKFWLPFIVNLVSLWLMWRADQKQARYMNPQAVQNAIAALPWSKALWRRYWPIFLILLLMIGTWIPYLAGVGNPEFEIHPLTWGPTSQPGAPLQGVKSLTVTIDGTVIPKSIRKRYRIAAVAFHYTGAKDVDDVEMSKSRAYDITDNTITLLIPLSDTFRHEMLVEGLRQTTYYILLVPQEYAMDDFATLRQAQALGVKKAGMGFGPP
jgi:hypothetical protein